MRCTNKHCRQGMDFFAITKIKETKKLFGLIKTIEIHKVELDLDDMEEYRDFLIECPECGSRMSYEDAVDAMENPMKHFDTDRLCSCGGEIWNDIEYTKPEEPEEDKEEFSGYQRKVKAGQIRSVFRCERCDAIHVKPGYGENLHGNE